MGRLTPAVRHTGACLLLVGLVGVVYGSSLGHEFVFDDWSLVVQNPVVRQPPSEVLDVFTSQVKGASYRPVRVASYMVDHWLAGGLEPAVFHASNLLYHAVAVLLLYALAWRTIGSFGGAIFAAALFAAHPLGSEAVAYVSGRRDLLSGLFCLAALLAWWGLCQPPRTRSPVLERIALGGWMVLALALAFGAKETAAVFPALAALLYVMSARRQDGPNKSSRGAWAALLLAAVVLYLLVDAFYLDRVLEALERLQGEALAPQPALTLGVLGTYTIRALWPLGLSADYTPPAWALPESALDARAIVAAVALAGMLLVGAGLIWRGRVAGAGLLWFLVALLPVAQIVPYREILAEHNAYLSLAGLALVAGDVGARLARRRPGLAWAAAAILLIAVASLTWVRTADWKNDEVLWEATLRVSPESVRARHNLAVALARRGDIPRARRLLTEAREQLPEDIRILLTLASIEERRGDQAAAVALARRAVEIQPDPETLTFLGWAYLASGRPPRAAEAFERALSENPRYSPAQDGLEALRDRAGRRTPGRQQ